MSTNPLVTAIIPTYNRSSVIVRTIENVLLQTYSPIEVIVVDDGSTDDTESVLKKFGSRIRWIKQQNAGPGAARNRGIELARGELVAFLDSDDSWMSAKVERQAKVLETAGPAAPCCLCNAILRFENGRTISSFENAPIRPHIKEGIWENPTEILMTRFVLFNQTVMVRRSVFERLGGFNEKFRCLEDYELALRLSFEGPWAFISEPLAVWNQGSTGSLSGEASIHQRRLKSTELEVLKGISGRLNTAGASTFREILSRRIRKVSRELRAVGLTEGTTRAERMLGHALVRTERLRSAIDRRLSGYPKIRVRPVPTISTYLQGSNLAMSPLAPTNPLTR